MTVARRARGKVVGQAARKSAGGGTSGPFDVPLNPGWEGRGALG